MFRYVQSLLLALFFTLSAPLGGATLAPLGAPQTKAEKSDVVASRRDIKTTVEVNAEGHFFHLIRLSNGAKIAGLYAGSMVTFYDSQGELVFRSGPHIHGLDGPLPWERTKVRTIQHKGDMGADKARRVAHIVIVHSRESKDIPFPNLSKIAEYVQKAAAIAGSLIR